MTIKDMINILEKAEKEYGNLEIKRKERHCEWGMGNYYSFKDFEIKVSKEEDFISINIETLV